MAKTVSVTITDDLDGSPGAETMAFSWRGTAYELDLAEQNAAQLRAALGPYIEAARRIPQARVARPAGPPVDRAAVRAWAAEQGLTVSGRGRISARVVEQYLAAQDS